VAGGSKRTIILSLVKFGAVRIPPKNAKFGGKNTHFGKFRGKIIF